MKQTPIEFLIERLAENGMLHSSDICKANEMFKEQIKSARHNGRQDFRSNGCMFKEDEQYYNETYGKQKDSSRMVG
jgi:hypothetical protein